MENKGIASRHAVQTHMKTHNYLVNPLFGILSEPQSLPNASIVRISRILCTTLDHKLGPCGTCHLPTVTYTVFSKMFQGNLESDI